MRIIFSLLFFFVGDYGISFRSCTSTSEPLGCAYFGVKQPRECYEPDLSWAAGFAKPAPGDAVVVLPKTSMTLPVRRSVAGLKPPGLSLVDSNTEPPEQNKMHTEVSAPNIHIRRNERHLENESFHAFFSTKQENLPAIGVLMLVHSKHTRV